MSNCRCCSRTCARRNGPSASKPRSPSSISRAIVSDPNLLLCDEPTGDLDRTSADEILSILQLLNKDLGKTIVMATHDPAAARYAQRTLHLDKGRFIERAELAA